MSTYRVRTSALVFSWALLVAIWLFSLLVLAIFQYKAGPYEPPMIFSIIWFGAITWGVHFVLRMPFETTLRADGTLAFRGILGRAVINIHEIKSVEAAPFGGPYLYVKHQRGKITMQRDIDGLYELIGKLKSLNPGIAVKGC